MLMLWNLTKRNMLIYLKDRAAIFFSLLSAMITIGLYAVFLAETNIRGVAGLVSASRQTLAYLVNSWTMAGIIVVNSVTVSLGVLGNMIEDEADRRLPAFLVSPASRFTLVMGYILAALSIGCLLCGVTFALSQVYIAATGGALLSMGQTLRVLLLIGISVFSATCTVFFLATFVHSRSAFSMLSTIVGSLIGFVAGIYIPIGVLPNAVQNFMKCTPVFYCASLLREIFMAQPMAAAFKGAPLQVTTDYLQAMGVTISWNGVWISNPVKIAVIVSSGVLFLLLSALVMRNRKMAV